MQHVFKVSHIHHALVLLLCISPPVFAQTTKRVTLHVDDPRPVAQAAKIVSVNHGLLIDYEDPEYSFDGDLKDITLQSARPEFIASHPGLKVLGINSRPIDVQYDVDAEGQPVSTSKFFDALIGAHAAADNPGRFVVTKDKDRYRIAPAQVRGGDGILAPTVPVLDTRISFPAQTRSGMSVVNLICTAVTAISGKSVVMATVPTNYLVQNDTAVGAANESAREVLIRVFESLRHRDSRVVAPQQELLVRLLYEPKQRFHLNIGLATVEVNAPGGGKVTRPLYKPPAGQPDIRRTTCTLCGRTLAECSENVQW